jgi:hypothetical protein
VARLVTLATIRARVLRRAHLGTASGSKLAPTAEVNDEINEGIASLYGKICQLQDQPYYLQQVTFNTVSGKDTYFIGAGQDVPITDFYKGKGVDIFYGQQIVRTAYPFTWNERNRYKYTSGWVYTQPVAYLFTGKNNLQSSAGNDSLKFIPLPSGSFAITLWYYPTAPTLVVDTDNFDGINGYEECVVLSTAIKLLQKQEQFEHAASLQGSLAMEEQRMADEIGSHDAENPPRVQDVRRDEFESTWSGPTGY